jgi:hypothetical protein
MKKTFILMLMLCTLLIINVFAEGIPAGTDIGDALYTDIKVYINNNYIPAYSYNGSTIVYADDLAKYGYSTQWNEKYRILTIKRDVQKAVTPIAEDLNINLGTKAYDVLHTNTRVYLDDRSVPTVSINNKVAIYVGDLSLFGTIVPDAVNKRIDVNLNSLYESNPLTMTFFVQDSKAIFNNNSKFEINIYHFTSLFYNVGTKKIETNERSEFSLGPEEEGNANIYGYSYLPYEDTNKYLYLGSVLKSIEYIDSRTHNYITYNNTTYQSNINYYKSATNIQRALFYRGLELKAFKEGLKKELQSNSNIPIKFTSINVDYNSIGNPVACLFAKNLTEKTIDAYELDIYCYDNYDRPVKHYLYKNNIQRGIYQNDDDEALILPGEIKGTSWTLYGRENTTKVKATLRTVHFTDGTTWKRK